MQATLGHGRKVKVNILHAKQVVTAKYYFKTNHLSLVKSYLISLQNEVVWRQVK